DDLIHTLQLWLNLPKHLKNTKTSYQNIYVEDVPVVPFNNGNLKVYSGKIAGVTGPMNSLVPITMTEISFKEAGVYTHVLPENHNAFLVVRSGEVEIGTSKIKLTKTGVATLTYKEDGSEQDSELVIKANNRAKLLVYSGVPLKEEVVAYGPFVMNTMEEIKQAFRDFHDGKFGPPAK